MNKGVLWGNKRVFDLWSQQTFIIKVGGFLSFSRLLFGPNRSLLKYYGAFFLQIKIRQLFYDQGGFFRPWCFLKIKLIFQDVRRLFKINRVKLFELFFTLSDHPSFLFFEGDTFVVKVGAFEDRGISFLVKIKPNFLIYAWLFMISSVLFHDQG